MFLEHPYKGADQSVPLTVERGRSDATFGGTRDALLETHRKALDAFSAQGLPKTSAPVLGETGGVARDEGRLAALLATRGLDF